MSYIVVEGTELVGKTTLIAKLHEDIKSRLVKEPFNETPQSKVVRKMIQGNVFPPEYETYMLLATRREMFRRLHNYYTGKSTRHIISDRNYLTSMVYQENKFTNMLKIMNLNREAIKDAGFDPNPDVLIYIDLKFETVLERLKTTSREEFNEKDKMVLNEKTFNNIKERYLKALDLFRLNNSKTKIIIIKEDFDYDELLKEIKEHI